MKEMTKLIKLQDYMSMFDIDTEIKAPFDIDGARYKIVKHYGANIYSVVHAELILGSFAPSGEHPTFRDVYKFLNKRIPEPKYLSIGDVLYDDCMKRYYIIARLHDDKINLISLHNGNSFSEPVRVNDVNAITFNEICDAIHYYNLKDFNYVGCAKDVLKVKE